MSVALVSNSGRGYYILFIADQIVRFAMNVDAASKQKLVTEVQGWLNDCVLGLSLCPYARAPLQAGRVRLTVVSNESELIESLPEELRALQGSEIETTLIILGSGLDAFLDFNDRLGDIAEWLDDVGLAEEFQLVGFHPAYRFAGESASDPGNFTNRSPYPIVQILRADSIARAAQDGDTLAIPERNIETLRALSSKQRRSLFPWV